MGLVRVRVCGPPAEDLRVLEPGPDGGAALVIVARPIQSGCPTKRLKSEADVHQEFPGNVI
jgi:hypothetical protein